MQSKLSDSYKSVFICVYLWIIPVASIPGSHNKSSFVSRAASKPRNVKAAAPVR